MAIESTYSNSYRSYKRYEHEILLDIMENLENSSLVIVQDTIFYLGINEIQHLVKYYQKIILNTLFFKDKNMLYEYNLWLYRVYYNKKLDLEFFYYLNDLFKKTAAFYIDHKVFIPIDELFGFILEKHDYFKDKSTKRLVLIDHEEEASKLVEYLISGKKQEVLEEFCKEIITLDQFIVFYDQIVSNAMKLIGYLWERAEVSIAKEHLASNTIEDVLLQVLNRLPQNEANKKHIFLSSAPHELHGLGVKIASIVFEKLGFQVTSLGVNIPSKEIKKAIREFVPDYVVFSATLQSSLIDIALLIDDLDKDRENFLKSFKIGIAGNGFEKVVHPTKTLKASFYIKELRDFMKLEFV